MTAMHAIEQLKSKVTDMQRQRTVGRLVKPGLRSRVGPQTIGFASQEPVEAILDDGTLVLYDGALIKSTQGHVQELKPQAGYRIWERMAARA